MLSHLATCETTGILCLLRQISSTTLLVVNGNSAKKLKSSKFALLRIQISLSNTFTEWYGCGKLEVIDTKIECWCCCKDEALEYFKLLGVYEIQ